ncbi:AraC family transcriptional regulator [Enterobacter mori]|uniref:AraC family transcriptional regulator n=1 Tax=Enterobacter mori TaxID=539813 RepID=UPI003891A34B
MIAEGLLLPVTILKNSVNHNVNKQEVWLIKKNENHDTCIQLRDNKKVDVWVCDEDCLLLLNSTTVTVISGTLVLRKVRIEMLSKLIAFIDEAERSSYNSDDDFVYQCIPVESTLFTKRAHSEVWLLHAHVTKEKWVYSLFNLVRRTEYYDLVRYLLSNYISKSFLYELGKKYGVSYSHFRRLCGYTLCGSVNKELGKWRVVSAIMEIIESRDDVTTIAYKYSYCSSSHFSWEAKRFFGYTPKYFTTKNNGLRLD